MASIIRITLLTSNDVSADRVQQHAKDVAAAELRSSVEANVYAEATIERVEQSELDALDPAKRPVRRRRSRR